MRSFLQDRLGVKFPIIQAPMAGTSTPAMAAAVANAGGLGSIGVGAVDAEGARKMIADVRAGTRSPFHVNVFCHRPPVARPEVESAWLARLAPHFAQVGATPPAGLKPSYRSFLEDESMFELFRRERPPVVSFHFGLPPADWIQALKAAGVVLLATATNVAEAQAIAEAGVDAIVAQGYEAGGHRGLFDSDGPDDRLSTLALVQLIVRATKLPVIAAGGIMDGRGVAAAMLVGACGAQLGTAFIGCPESSADSGFRKLLKTDAAYHTTMTRAISGRPARCLPNRFTAIGDQARAGEVPDYPIAYDAGKALNAAAKMAGEFGYGAQWAGQGAPLSRELPAGELVQVIAAELEAAIAAPRG